PVILTLLFSLQIGLLSSGISVISARGPHLKVRSKRFVRARVNNNCSTSEYVPSGKNYCCNKCTRGHYVRKVCGGAGLRTDCAQCRNGTFLAAENSLSKCKACTVCDPVLNQIELKTCEPHVDRQCTCPKNSFQRWLDDTTFHCQNCTVCKTETIEFCTETSDTVCGCEENWFYHTQNKVCQPCHSCSGDRQCKLCRNGHPPFFLLSIASCSIVALIVMVGAGYLIFRRTKKGCRWRASARSVRSGDLFRSEVKGSTPEGSRSPDHLLPVQEEGGGRPSLLTPTHLTELPDCVQVAGTAHLPDDQRLSYAVADSGARLSLAGVRPAPGPVGHADRAGRDGGPAQLPGGAVPDVPAVAAAAGTGAGAEAGGAAGAAPLQLVYPGPQRHAAERLRRATTGTTSVNAHQRPPPSVTCLLPPLRPSPHRPHPHLRYPPSLPPAPPLPSPPTSVTPSLPPASITPSPN
ncbi:tumor necrosis factor receptor superfamily member 1A-like, partial [Mobula birostris]|uniref:tumor necrosis factor receptor superfamily member 1A-like n=1 Tax=Mobula birostris TaxID=1983395 RepID=UPI003B27F3BD